jgi:hypothetical protein
MATFSVRGLFTSGLGTSDVHLTMLATNPPLRPHNSFMKSSTTRRPRRADVLWLACGISSRCASAYVRSGFVRLAISRLTAAGVARRRISIVAGHGENMRRTFILTLLSVLLLSVSASAETDGSFIVNSFPGCKGKAVFSPYSAGATGAIEAEQRAAWYAKLRPILGAPCVIRADYGAVTFCGKLVCRNIAIDQASSR